jgi:hypothetical protein
MLAQIRSRFSQETLDFVGLSYMQGAVELVLPSVGNRALCLILPYIGVTGKLAHVLWLNWFDKLPSLCHNIVR